MNLSPIQQNCGTTIHWAVPIHSEDLPIKPQQVPPAGLEKIKNLASYIFSFCFFPSSIYQWISDRLHRCAGKILIPAQLKEKNPQLLELGRAELVNRFQGISLALQTSDKVTIDAMYLPGKKGKEPAPRKGSTIICFNGNGGKYEHLGLVMDYATYVGEDDRNIKYKQSVGNIAKLIKRGHNVLLFNYRGVSRSQGEATRDGLILDGETVYHYVKSLGVCNGDILLYGHSFGGAIATQVAAKYDGVKLINDRSFSSLANVVRILIGKKSTLLGIFLSKIVKVVAWNFDTIAAWEKVKGKKWIAFHREDPLILFEASLYYALTSSNVKVGGTELMDKSKVYAFYQRKIARQNPLLLSDRAHKVFNELSDQFSNRDPHSRKLLPPELYEILSQIEA